MVLCPQVNQGSYTNKADNMTGSPPKKFVAYYRVSTNRQGRSGLGLDAQRKAVTDYLNGAAWEMVGDFTEVESGKRDRNRPELESALDACRRSKSTLIIAKLDRLARNVHFISGLIESGVTFVAADMPHADKTMMQMMAVFAEMERDMISRRTKDALTAAKARGVKLGITGKVRARENQIAADDHALAISEDVRRLRRGRSVRALTDAMNAEAIKTARGGFWHPSTVHRLLKRLDSRDLVVRSFE